MQVVGKIPDPNLPGSPDPIIIIFYRSDRGIVPQVPEDL
jgi:hypothetical protein